MGSISVFEVGAASKALEEAEERGVLQVFDKEEPLEERALRMACDEVFEESNGKWKPWASNGKSIRIGEIILLVDSDTIVPEDCLWDAARELTESPEVAIIQHKSDIMQVAHHYFENGIAHFTRRINRAISLLSFRWPGPLFQQTAKRRYGPNRMYRKMLVWLCAFKYGVARPVCGGSRCLTDATVVEGLYHSVGNIF